MKTVMGLVLAFLIGIVCRLSGIPVPAPPAIVGALLVVSMTVGYLLADRALKRPARLLEHRGGPTEAGPSNPGRES